MKFAVVNVFLTKASTYQLCTINRFSFYSLLDDPENIDVNFKDYLNGSSTNVQDVSPKLQFCDNIKCMVKSNTLCLVIEEKISSKEHWVPDKISAVDCGYIFEDPIQRFSEDYREEAGAYFTSRNIIYFLTGILAQ